MDNDVLLFKKYCPYCQEYFFVKTVIRVCPKCGKKIPQLGTIRNKDGVIIG